MFSRILFCVNDPSHADYCWAAESTFLHMRKFDALGNTTAQWTFPVTGTAPGEVRCAVCGAPVYVAAGAPPSEEQAMACDFLGRCRTAPADANLARLELLAARLTEHPFPAERQRLISIVDALYAAIRDNPIARAVLEKHGVGELYPDSAS